MKNARHKNLHELLAAAYGGERVAAVKERAELFVTQAEAGRAASVSRALIGQAVSSGRLHTFSLYGDTFVYRPQVAGGLPPNPEVQLRRQARGGLSREWWNIYISYFRAQREGLAAALEVVEGLGVSCPEEPRLRRESELVARLVETAADCYRHYYNEEPDALQTPPRAATGTA